MASRSASSDYPPGPSNISNFDSKMAKLLGHVSEGTGASSLRSMAMRSVCINIKSLNQGFLDRLPLKVGSELWTMINANGLDNIRTWKVFAHAYGRDKAGGFFDRYLTIRNPELPLSLYSDPTLSESAQWLTILNLHNVKCSRYDMVNLSRLPNLAALTIGEFMKMENDQIDDTVFRAWALRATEFDGFERLKVLILEHQYAFSKSAIEYTLEIPSLHYLVVPAKHMVQSTKGWKVSNLNALQGESDDTELEPVVWDAADLLKMAARRRRSGEGAEFPRPKNITLLDLTLGHCRNEGYEFFLWRREPQSPGCAWLFERDRSFLAGRSDPTLKRRATRIDDGRARKKQMRASVWQDAAKSLEDFKL